VVWEKEKGGGLEEDVSLLTKGGEKIALTLTSVTVDSEEKTIITGRHLPIAQTGIKPDKSTIRSRQTPLHLAT